MLEFLKVQHPQYSEEWLKTREIRWPTGSHRQTRLRAQFEVLFMPLNEHLDFTVYTVCVCVCVCNSFLEIQFTKHTVYIPCKGGRLSIFTVFTELCYHYFNQFYNVFITPKTTLYPLAGTLCFCLLPHTTPPPSLQSSVDRRWVVSTYWILWVMGLWLLVYVFCVNILWCLLCVYLEIELLDQMVTLFCLLRNLCIMFPLGELLLFFLFLTEVKNTAFISWYEMRICVL